MERLIRGEAVTIYGDGTQTRDFVAVQDVVEGVYKAATLRPQAICNIGTGKEISVLTLLAEIARSLKIETPTPLFAGSRLGEQMRSCIDAQLAGKVLDWQARHSLQSGMELTAAWYRAQLGK
jgi:nucleoside-diphosphate-sugar epimerase